MDSTDGARSSVLITNGNALAMISLAPWMDQFGHTIRKVYLTTRLPGSKSNVRGGLQMLRHSGWAYTYFKVWANRVLPWRLRQQGLPGSVPDYLQMRGLDVDVEEVTSVNTRRVVEEARSLEADYLVSNSATQRFRAPLISTPRIGAVNMHCSPLPAYAGLSPYFWQLFHGEPTFTVTLHQIVETLDAGPIIDQASGPLTGVRTALEAFLRMVIAEGPLFVRLFRGESDIQQARSQDLTTRSYFAHPTRRDMRTFRRQGLRMMDRVSRRAVIEHVRHIVERPAVPVEKPHTVRTTRKDD
ncbi:MAG: formyltransferase family protein [Pirellulales bacterium]